MRKLTFAEFLYLLKCDGQTEIDPNGWPEEPAWLKRNNIVIPSDGSRKLLPEQEYRCYPNRYFPYFELSLTGRCKMCCRHCFNAPDQNPRIVKPSLEQLTDSFFLRCLDCSRGELKRRNAECVSCEWTKVCGMGCRAEAIMHGSGMFGIDRRMCHFFKDGIYDRIVELAERVGKT